jgi:lambda family phage portal protein
MTNLLDKAIAVVAPRAAFRRAQYRQALNVIGKTDERRRDRALMLDRRRYEGAARGRRTAGWRSSGASAADEIREALGVLRNRSRDLTRNNGWWSRAIRVWVNNTVGETGLTPALPANMDRTLKDKILGLWKDWAHTTAIDVEGRSTFVGLQILLQRSIVEGGESLGRFVVSTDRNLPLGLQLQLLEPDHIDTSKEFTTPRGRIINGVEFNKKSQRLGYWLFETHPGTSTVIGRTRFGESKFIDAAEILHPYRTDRIGQVRGVPWGAPVMLATRDFDDYTDAQLLRQKIAACFVGFTHMGDPPPGDIEDPGRDDVMEFEPGTIDDLPPGREITFSKPPGVENMEEYSGLTLRQIAMGFGVSVEAMTGDLSKVNFSSGRMGHLEFQREVRTTRAQVLVPLICQPIWRRFVTIAQIQGKLPDGIPMTVEWIPPREEMIDPTKEVPAITRKIRSGQSTLSRELQRAGIADTRAFLEERQADDKMLDEMSIVLTSDPRQGVGSSDAGEASVGGDEQGSNRLARIGSNGGRLGAHAPESREDNSPTRLEDD